MSHGESKMYKAYVTEDGRNFYHIYTSNSREKTESYLNAYLRNHEEVQRAYIDKIVSFKNDKRRDWNE